MLTYTVLIAASAAIGSSIFTVLIVDLIDHLKSNA